MALFAVGPHKVFNLVVDGVAAAATVLSMIRIALALDATTLVRWLWTLLVGLSMLLWSFSTFVK